jgi:hypothetical protein
MLAEGSVASATTQRNWPKGKIPTGVAKLLIGKLGFWNP